MAKLFPSKTKYRKTHRGILIPFKKANKCNNISFGTYALQAIGRGLITASQIESARISINRHLKRKGKLWLRIFPHKPITRKPAETRMGKGKGNVEYWSSVIKSGTILFEVSGVSVFEAQRAMQLADGKLPIKCKFIVR